MNRIADTVLLPRTDPRFNESLRALRAARGWSQSMLCCKVGVSKSMGSLWETGRAVPRIQHYQKLKEVLEQSIHKTVDGMPVSNIGLAGYKIGDLIRELQARGATKVEVTF